MRTIKSFNELFPKRNNKIVVSASANKGFMQFQFKGIPKGEFLDRFRRATNEASILIARDLKIALDEAMQSDVWPVLSGVGDIIDTGRLMESGQVALSGDSILISYNEPYAALVQFGGYIAPYGNQSLRVYLPPRPWVEAVLTGNGPVPAFNFASYYEKAIQVEFRK